MYFVCCGSAGFLVVVENRNKDGFTLRDIWGENNKIRETYIVVYSLLSHDRVHVRAASSSGVGRLSAKGQTLNILDL